MARLSMAALWTVVLPSSLFAGTVVFDPPYAQVQPGESAEFDVWIGSTNLTEFDSVSILIGSDDLFSLQFRYDHLGRFCATGFHACSSPPGPLGVYTRDIGFGNNDLVSPFFTAPLLAGKLLVGTTGIAPGGYEIIVSAEEEVRRVGLELSVIAAGSAVEPLEGRATITLIPEPEGLALLLAGAILVRPHRQWHALEGAVRC